MLPATCRLITSALCRTLTEDSVGQSDTRGFSTSLTMSRTPKWCDSAPALALGASHSCASADLGSLAFFSLPTQSALQEVTHRQSDSLANLLHVRDPVRG